MNKEKWSAALRRFFHCLNFFHQSTTAIDDGKVVWLGCDCGKTFYGEKPKWYSDLEAGRGK
jgi:hypothetical protein